MHCLLIYENLNYWNGSMNLKNLKHNTVKCRLFVFAINLVQSSKNLKQVWTVNI